MHQNGLQNFENKSKDTYLNAGYILLDANEPNDKNIASVIFRSDEAAFMSGIATCQYLNDNFDEYKSGGLRVGTFGGIAIPSVTIYMGGFEYGIKI
jgi:basic membrane lipoprotein Med (substrate-binding protein (PBP1-ABC) superfamily)